MKGVILGICPDVTLVDVTHDVPPHDVLTGALELGAAYKYFPVGTIFVAVVDPGVGSARRGIAADTGDYRFVAPDNGVLTAVLPRGRRRSKIVELTERRYARPTVSRTFEGRDRFAPAAAWLAKGIAAVGARPPAADIQRLDIPAAGSRSRTRSAGVVVRIDRFGNLVTNIDRKAVEQFAHSTAHLDRGRDTPHRAARRHLRRAAARRRRRALRQHRPPRAGGAAPPAPPSGSAVGPGRRRHRHPARIA